MKRTTYIILIFCASISAQAQPGLFDRNVDWTPFTSVNKAISLNNGSWVVAGQYLNLFDNRLIRLNSEGDTLWTVQIQATWVTDMAYFNGKIYLTGTIGGGGFPDCMYPPFYYSNQMLYAEVHDTFGNLINSTDNYLYENPSFFLDSIISQGDSSSNISGPYDNSYPHPFQVAVVNENAVLLSVGDELLMTNPLATVKWQKIWQKQFKGKINSMRVVQPYIYLATDSGIIQVDTTGTIIRSDYSYGPATESYQTGNGNLYFTAGHFLLHMDSDLNVVDSFNLSRKFSQWRGLNGNDNKEVIAGKDIMNNSIVIALFDSSLSFQNEFTLSNQCSLPVDVAAYDGLLLVTGNDSLHIPDFAAFPSIPNITSVNSIYYKTYTLSGSENGKQAQVSFIAASTDSIRVGYGAELFQYSSLLLKNIGYDTITSLSITADNLAFDCVDGPSFIKYQNLNVLPGDSFRLDSLNYQAFVGRTISIYPIRFYVTSINGARVGQSCNPITKQLSTYINSISTPQPSTFKLFPNPTDGIINIQVDALTNSTFTLSDMSGKVLIEKKLVQANEQLNISTLASGMYIYTVRSGDQLPLTGKVVRE